MKFFLVCAILSCFAYSVEARSPLPKDEALSHMQEQQDYLKDRLKKYDQAIDILQQQLDEKNGVERTPIKMTEISEVTTTLTPTVEEEEEEVPVNQIKNEMPIIPTPKEEVEFMAWDIKDFLPQLCAGLVIIGLLFTLWIERRSKAKISNHAIDFLNARMAVLIAYKKDVQQITASEREKIKDSCFGRWVLNEATNVDLMDMYVSLWRTYGEQALANGIQEKEFRKAAKYVLSSN